MLQSPSNEPNLLHDPKELVLIDLAIAVKVCRLDHAVDGCVVEVEVALAQHVLELGAVQVASVVVVEMLEHLQHLHF